MNPFVAFLLGIVLMVVAITVAVRVGLFFAWVAFVAVIGLGLYAVARHLTKKS